MSQIIIIALLSICSIISYLLSLTSIIVFLPQFLALLALLFIIFHKYHLPQIYLISLIVNLTVFATNGLNSPFFCFIYFLLFVIAFLFPPEVSLAQSLISILLLSQSLNSISSFIPLISLIFITPIAWFISRQVLSEKYSRNLISFEETDFLLWLNLKFKTGITAIINSATEALNTTPLSSRQKDQLQHIKQSAKSLLNSSQNLTREIDDTPDEI